MIDIPWLKRLLSPAALCGLLFFCAPHIYAAERLASGQWEFAMTTDGSTRTISQCITAEKAKEVNGDSKSGREYAEKGAKGRCSVRSYDVSGDTVSYSLMCGSTQIESVQTYHGDSSDGTKTTTTDGKTVKTQVKARRLGACR
jgi:hypothetical protein